MDLYMVVGLYTCGLIHRWAYLSFFTVCYRQGSCLNWLNWLILQLKVEILCRNIKIKHIITKIIGYVDVALQMKADEISYQEKNMELLLVIIIVITILAQTNLFKYWILTDQVYESVYFSKYISFGETIII